MKSHMERNSFLAQIKTNIRNVEQQIQEACLRSNRKRSEINIVCVTKYLSNEYFSYLKDTPEIKNIGENRIQVLTERFKIVPPNAFNWHFIGHLQSNKISKIPPLSLIHSVDSLNLLKKLENHYQKNFPQRKTIYTSPIKPHPRKNKIWI